MTSVYTLYIIFRQYGNEYNIGIGEGDNKCVYVFIVRKSKQRKV